MKHKQLSIFDSQPQPQAQVRDKATEKTHLTPQPNSVIGKMRAISIHAPHAYAICLGKKPMSIETLPQNLGAGS
jgi:hypothetical protein